VSFVFTSSLLPSVLATCFQSNLLIPLATDQSSTNKREVALRTLGQLVKSTGYVISPFLHYTSLLDILLNLVKTERNATIRREVIRVIGILGALDPYKYKMSQLRGRREDQKLLDDKGLLGMSLAR
jgi:serine/threonine-protein kinase mTOR